jgi:lysophospholipase L1-like esterase
MKLTHLYLFFIILFINLQNQFGQSLPYKPISYSFIDESKNKIEFCGDSYKYFVRIFEKIDKLTLKGEGQIKVIHIGDSHIQADYFSDRFRENLQNLSLGIKGSRGFLFPYNIARTNNPENYKVKFHGNWSNCKNIHTNPYCFLGISGITIYTYDTNSKIQIIPVKKMSEIGGFNTVKVLHSAGDSIFSLSLIVNDTINGHFFADGYTQFRIDDYIDTLNLIFKKNDSLQKMIDIRGIELESDDPGIVYSSVGVNGAEVTSFLKCNMLENDLKILKPDWIIISLGTNDVYSSKFEINLFNENFFELLKRIRQTLPDVAILITTPPDSFRKRTYPNQDLPVLIKNLYKLAEENNCALWDLYNIMGGYSSIKIWYSKGLAASDKVHFSKEGYNLQGDLIYNSFVESYDNYLSKKIKRNGIH